MSIGSERPIPPTPQEFTCTMSAKHAEKRVIAAESTEGVVFEIIGKDGCGKVIGRTFVEDWGALEKFNKKIHMRHLAQV